MHIHILGIAGKMTAPLAVELKNKGHLVTGSDQQLIYPPVSTLLAKNKITINSTPINSHIDLAIIGTSYKLFTQTKKEFSQIKLLKIPYISVTKYIAKNLIKTNSVLVAGSFGKSTITSLLVHILKLANFKPSYMFGATSLNNYPSLAINLSNWSIVEADESINGLDKQAKFLYYPIKYLIITSTDWEHKDSYPSHLSQITAFKKLIQKVPPDGLLIYNPQDRQLKKLIKYCGGLCLPYSNNITYPNSLLGNYNQQNITAAATLCLRLNIDNQIIKAAIKDYRGLKRRLQILKKTKNTIIIDDFAQSAPRIKTAIQSIKKAYPNYLIKVFFEAHASFLQKKQGLKNLKTAFKPVTEVILAKLTYHSQISKTDRTTVRHFKKEIGTKLRYLPFYQQIQKHYLTTLEPKQILIHFSSGGLTGLKTLQKITTNM